jgi:hypothetical protein
MKWSEEMDKKYVESEGSECPACGGNVEGTGLDYTDGSIYQRCKCTDCGEAWFTRYVLDGIANDGENTL